MQLLSLVNWLLRRRLRQSWLLLAVTSFGILASVTIMSTGALYSRALGEAGLRHAVASFRPEVLNSQITVQNRPLGRADYLPLQSLVQEVSDARLAPMLRGTERFGRTQSNLPLLNTPSQPVLGSPSGRPCFLTGLRGPRRPPHRPSPLSGAPAGQEDPEADGGGGAAHQVARKRRAGRAGGHRDSRRRWDIQGIGLWGRRPDILGAHPGIVRANLLRGGGLG